MSFTVTARNVNEALPLVLDLIREHGKTSDSRNGKVLRLPKPIVVEYTHPKERVLFSPERDANPFFHLMESLWMLAGREDTQFPVFFAKNLATYSDDGKTLNGAYGYRWRKHFAYNNGGKIMDQLEEAINILKADPNSRRVVVSMWDGYNDLTNQKSKDIPCNTHLYLEIQDNRLNMTVCNRSNDIIWGMCGANVVHFSILQEYVASKLEIDVGSYFQISNNAHCYVENEVYQKTKNLFKLSKFKTYFYPFQNEKTYPVCASPTFDKELQLFFKYFDSGFKDKNCLLEIFKLNESGFMWTSAVRMLHSYRHYKNKNKDEAILNLSSLNCEDWKLACTQWLNRRKY